MSDDVATRAEALIDELYSSGIHPTPLESKLGWLLMEALGDHLVETRRFAGRGFDDLLFNEWKPGLLDGDFSHFLHDILEEGYAEEPGPRIRELLTEALIIQSAIDCDPPERVIALFAEEADFRARHPDDDFADFGDPAEALRWADEWRRKFATKGWAPSGLPDPRGWSERDFTMDRCRACGRLRQEGKVMADIPGFGPEERFDDPCIRDLPGVGLACCGHGHSGKAVYVSQLHGPDAARKMRELGGNPPPQAFYLDPIGEAPAA